MKRCAFFEILMETENSCCVSRFPLIASCYKLLTAKLLVSRFALIASSADC